jgi:phage terminase small subunit
MKKIVFNQEAAIRSGLPAAIAALYSDAVDLYNEAAKNISEFGAVTAHPRTGAPIENPYIKIRDGASKQIQQIHKNFPDYF